MAYGLTCETAGLGGLISAEELVGWKKLYASEWPDHLFHSRPQPTHVTIPLRRDRIMPSIKLGSTTYHLSFAGDTELWIWLREGKNLRERMKLNLQGMRSQFWLEFPLVISGLTAEASAAVASEETVQPIHLLDNKVIYLRGRRPETSRLNVTLEFVLTTVDKKATLHITVAKGLDHINWVRGKLEPSFSEETPF